MVPAVLHNPTNMKKLIICICVFALIGNISYGQNLYDKIHLDCYNEGQAKSILCPVFVNGRLPENPLATFGIQTTTQVILYGLFLPGLV